MKIKRLADGALRIKGDMSGEEDYRFFKKTIRDLNLKENDTLRLVILDASEVNPSIYGLLLKMYNQEHVNIVLDVMNLKLAYYLRDVHLLQTFNVTLMNPQDAQ